MLVGQALATANLCAECGERLRYSRATGQPCERGAPDAHYHERQALYAHGPEPVCHRCWLASGKACNGKEGS